MNGLFPLYCSACINAIFLYFTGDYAYSKCLRTSPFSCQCEENPGLNFDICLKRPNGLYEWPGRRWSPYFIKCVDARTIPSECTGASMIYDAMHNNCNIIFEVLNLAYNLSLNLHIPESLAHIYETSKPRVPASSSVEWKDVDSSALMQYSIPKTASKQWPDKSELVSRVSEIQKASIFTVSRSNSEIYFDQSSTRLTNNGDGNSILETSFSTKLYYPTALPSSENEFSHYTNSVSAHLDHSHSHQISTLRLNEGDHSNDVTLVTMDTHMTSINSGFISTETIQPSFPHTSTSVYGSTFGDNVSHTDEQMSIETGKLNIQATSTLGNEVPTNRESSLSGHLLLNQQSTELESFQNTKLFSTHLNKTKPVYFSSVLIPSKQDYSASLGGNDIKWSDIYRTTSNKFTDAPEHFTPSLKVTLNSLKATLNSQTTSVISQWIQLPLHNHTPVTFSETRLFSFSQTSVDISSLSSTSEESFDSVNNLGVNTKITTLHTSTDVYSANTASFDSSYEESKYAVFATSISTDIEKVSASRLLSETHFVFSETESSFKSHFTFKTGGLANSLHSLYAPDVLSSPFIYHSRTGNIHVSTFLTEHITKRLSPTQTKEGIDIIPTLQTQIESNQPIMFPTQSGIKPKVHTSMSPGTIDFKSSLLITKTTPMSLFPTQIHTKQLFSDVTMSPIVSPSFVLSERTTKLTSNPVRIETRQFTSTFSQANHLSVLPSHDKSRELSSMELKSTTTLLSSFSADTLSKPVFLISTRTLPSSLPAFQTQAQSKPPSEHSSKSTIKPLTSVQIQTTRSPVLLSSMPDMINQLSLITTQLESKQVPSSQMQTPTKLTRVPTRTVTKLELLHPTDSSITTLPSLTRQSSVQTSTVTKLLFSIQKPTFINPNFSKSMQSMSKSFSEETKQTIATQFHLLQTQTTGSRSASEEMVNAFYPSTITLPPLKTKGLQTSFKTASFESSASYIDSSILYDTPKASFISSKTSLNIKPSVTSHFMDNSRKDSVSNKFLLKDTDETSAFRLSVTDAFEIRTISESIIQTSFENYEHISATSSQLYSETSIPDNDIMSFSDLAVFTRQSRRVSSIVSYLQTATVLATPSINTDNLSSNIFIASSDTQTSLPDLDYTTFIIAMSVGIGGIILLAIFAALIACVCRSKHRRGVTRFDTISS